MGHDVVLPISPETPMKECNAKRQDLAGDLNSAAVTDSG
jgi:hypothetical protein